MELKDFYKKWIKPTTDFLSCHWLALLFLIGFIYLGFQFGFMSVSINIIFGMSLFLYGIIRFQPLNNFIRMILNMRVNEDDKKAKEKSGYYKRKANKVSFKVIR